MYLFRAFASSLNINVDKGKYIISLIYYELLSQFIFQKFFFFFNPFFIVSVPGSFRNLTQCTGCREWLGVSAFPSPSQRSWWSRRCEQKLEEEQCWPAVRATERCEESAQLKLVFCFVWFCSFETMFHYIALAVLELSLWRPGWPWPLRAPSASAPRMWG